MEGMRGWKGIELGDEGGRRNGEGEEERRREEREDGD